jgi:hypothetical protein
MLSAIEVGELVLLLLVCAPYVVRFARWLVSEPSGVMGAAIRVAVLLALLQGLGTL